MKIKTEILIEEVLDWAVSKCQGIPVDADEETLYCEGLIYYDVFDNIHWDLHPYSTNWTYGGPIKDREKILIVDWDSSTNQYFAKKHDQYESDCYAFGETQLIAAMRCFVASKLGNEVEIPEYFIKSIYLRDKTLLNLFT